MSFAPSWLAVCALLACAAAAALPRRSNCTDFLQDFRFDEGSLQGIWSPVYAWPAPASSDANATDVLLGAESVSFYPLVPGEVDGYARDMSAHFPTISWESVRFTWNLATHRPRLVKPYGYTDTLRFVLELGDGLARTVRAVPAGATFALALKSGTAAVAPPSYQFRMIGDYLAVAACDTNSAHLLHKGMAVPDEAEVQRIVSRVKTEGVKD